MVENSYPDINTLCRLCLKEHNNAFSIFAEDGSLSVQMRLMACISLEAKTTDGLPKKLCSDCRYQLEKSFLFRQRSQLTDKKLRKHIRLVSTGKKSRVFEPQDDGEDEDDELEESIAFVNEQEKEREKNAEELRKKCKQDMEKEFQKRLAIAKVELRTEVAEQVRQELVDEVRQDVRRQLLDEVQEESRKIQLTKLVDEIQIFLCEKKADMCESSETEAAEPLPPKPVQPIKRLRKRLCDSSNQPLAQRLKLAISDEDTNDGKLKNELQPMGNVDIDLTDSTMSDGHELHDIKLVGAGNVINNDSQDGEIYIINNAAVTENSKPTSSTGFQMEMDKNITSYNIKDNGEIQFSGTKTEQMGNVVLLDIDTELGDDINLSDFDQNVIILSDKAEDPIDVRPIKHIKDEYVVLKTLQDGKPRAGRVTDTIKTFRCHMCPIEFATEKSLTRHLNTHVKTMKNGKGKGYKCSVCELQLSCGSSLKRHMIIHTGIKPHKCDECGQSFVQREVLKRHMDTHTGEKRHQCPHCDVRFAQKTNLHQHISKVHLEKPRMHQCHLCNRCFRHVSGLSRHLVTHAGVMFACKECGRQFADRSSIRRHIHNVHKIKEKMADGYVAESSLSFN